MKPFSFHSSGHDEYLNTLKQAYDRSVQQINSDVELTDAEKTAALLQLRQEYDAKIKKASFGSFVAQ